MEQRHTDTFPFSGRVVGSWLLITCSSQSHYGEMRIWGYQEVGSRDTWRVALTLLWDVALLILTLASKPKLGPEWLKILPIEKKDPFIDHSWTATRKGLWHRTKLSLSFSNPASFYFWQTGSTAYPRVCCKGEHLSPPIISLWWHPVCQTHFQPVSFSLVYWFPTAAVTNNHRLSSLKQHKFIIWQYLRSEVHNQSHWAKIKELTELNSIQRPYGLFPCLFQLLKTTCIPCLTTPHHSDLCFHH